MTIKEAIKFIISQNDDSLLLEKDLMHISDILYYTKSRIEYFAIWVN